MSLASRLACLCGLLMATEASWSQQVFHSVTGSLCVNPEFAQNPPAETSIGGCAFMCSLDQRCQAFTTADGPCQLFVFDKCSKSVRACSCSRRGQLFVKRQPGLEPGALCPSGYGDELCGVKYRILYGSGRWSSSRETCESEPGLVIMADVMDVTEVEQVEMLYNNSSVAHSLWLGGFQLPGSPEPAGGWFWASCGGSVSASLWATREPSVNRDAENVTGKFHSKIGLADFPQDYFKAVDALCECVSPFD